MNVLVTGATGFLGSYLVHALLQKGHSVTIIKRQFSNNWRIRDIADDVASFTPERLEEAFSGRHIDFIFNTACAYGRKNEPIASIEDANVLFPLKVLEAGIAHGAGCFVNADTFLDRSVSLYSMTKNHFSDLLKRLSDRIIVANMKIEHMYGPLDDQNKFIGWLISQLENDIERIDLTSGIQMRDFVYIDDVVEAFLGAASAADSQNRCCEYEVGSGNSIPVKKFVDELYSQYRKANPACSSSLNYGAIRYRDNEPMEVRVNLEKLNRIGWKAKVGYIEGIQKILAKGFEQ